MRTGCWRAWHRGSAPPARMCGWACAAGGPWSPQGCSCPAAAAPRPPPCPPTPWRPCNDVYSAGGQRRVSLTKPSAAAGALSVPAQQHRPSAPSAAAVLIGKVAAPTVGLLTSAFRPPSAGCWTDLRGLLASDRWMSRCAANGWRGRSASARAIRRSASAALGRSTYSCSMTDRGHRPETTP